jgi:hypothetical protein
MTDETETASARIPWWGRESGRGRLEISEGGTSVVARAVTTNV